MGSSVSIVNLPDSINETAIDELLTEKHASDFVKVKCHELFDASKDTSGMISKFKGMRIVDKLQTISNNAVSQKETENIDRSKTDAVVQLLRFDHFKESDGYPCFTTCREFLVTLDKVDISTSFVVFISHAWLRSNDTCEGFDGTAQPDTVDHSQFNICVKGIEHLMRSAAHGMQTCYIWCAYSCADHADHSGIPADSTAAECQETAAPQPLHPLDSIMECCDCLFTPIFDPDASWELPPLLANYYTDYNPLPWNGPSSYLSRAWCRLEMLYASQIPLYPHSDKKTRDQRFTGRLHHHSVGGHRPHVLYGSFESRMTLPPIVMPPLPSKLYPKFDPMEGHVTAATDKDLIARLCMHLHDHHSCVLRMGYSGETDDQDLMHGHGTYRYENGDVYVGDWAHGMKHGIGVFTSGSGEVYEGEYNADHRVGLCKFRYKDGCIFYGEMSHGKKHGLGVLEYPNGDLFEGLFRKDRKEGHGVMRFTGGNDFYDGEYKRDKKHGQGVLKVGNTTLSGQFRDDSFQQPPP